MAVKGRHPREGGDGGGYWKWTKVFPGRECDGWIAGDIHVFPAHMGRPSVVCERTLTHGRLPCSFCSQKLPVRDLGYLPVYRHDGLPCVLHIHEYAFDTVGLIRFRDPIVWTRGDDDDGEAVVVKPRLRGGRWESSIAARMLPQDITVAMVRYWKRRHLLPDLVRWINGVTDKSDESPPAELSRIAKEQQAQREQRGKTTSRDAIEQVTGERLPPLIGDPAREMLRRNREAAAAVERNGKPH